MKAVLLTFPPPPNPASRTTIPISLNLPPTNCPAHLCLLVEPVDPTVHAPRVKVWISPPCLPRPPTIPKVLNASPSKPPTSETPAGNNHFTNNIQTQQYWSPEAILIQLSQVYASHPSPSSPGLLATLLQIVRLEGITLLWQGIAPTLMISNPAQAIYMLGYDSLCSAFFDLVPMTSRDAPASASLPAVQLILLVSGVLSCLFVVVLFSPLELIPTRLQSTPRVRPQTVRLAPSISRKRSAEWNCRIFTFSIGKGLQAGMGIAITINAGSPPDTGGGAQNTAKKSHEDPFGSPTSSAELPPLPTRPGSSTAKNSTPHANDIPAPTPASDPKVDPAKPTNSSVVRQICAMGFDCKAVIQVLKQDNRDMDRALIPLLAPWGRGRRRRSTAHDSEIGGGRGAAEGSTEFICGAPSDPFLHTPSEL
ncbi:hypothetical protein PCANC_22871 [Puccinia coronata f. sp. avenae]|uniref:UBA domain-containing protein n=1 Tax=Puccinia coronata f. sp. avenae TaxID=200324 RepID=A0A2N5UC26_9BASI|nr:hypothetical protein PCANC_22871 [Puccinia coronata f. sp. avenae]PLW35286.1 hypothetical protein PCASD_13678 [Puccinia coronata f. sp. avenae]